MERKQDAAMPIEWRFLKGFCISNMINLIRKNKRFLVCHMECRCIKRLCSQEKNSAAFKSKARCRSARSGLLPHMKSSIHLSKMNFFTWIKSPACNR
jgi:hypothetical protein